MLGIVFKMDQTDIKFLFVFFILYFVSVRLFTATIFLATQKT